MSRKLDEERRRAYLEQTELENPEPRAEVLPGIPSDYEPTFTHDVVKTPEDEGKKERFNAEKLEEALSRIEKSQDRTEKKVTNLSKDISAVKSDVKALDKRLAAVEGNGNIVSSDSADSVIEGLPKGFDVPVVAKYRFVGLAVENEYLKKLTK